MMKPGTAVAKKFMNGVLLLEEHVPRRPTPTLTLFLPETVEDGVRIPAQSMVIPSFWVKELYELLRDYYQSPVTDSKEPR